MIHRLAVRPSAAADLGPALDPAALARLDEAAAKTAARRLPLTALVLSAAMLVSLGVTFVLTDVLDWTDPAAVLVLRGCAVLLILASAGVWLLARSREIGPRLLLNVGLVYEVVGTLGLALPVFFNSDGPPRNLVHVPWVCVWLVLFPLIVPVRLRKAAIAGFAAASMVPLALLVWILAGHAAPSAPVVTYALLPGYLCAALALLPAAVLFDLRLALARSEQERQSLGSYRLGKLIGKGGMGEVWRADHTLLARRAAIKIVRPERLAELDDAGRQSALTRFEREARVTASLRCPHTIELFDFGRTEEGGLYYVMELLDGLDLDTLVREHEPLSPARTVYVLRQVCLSLAEAHAQGLVHRDIKPANIFLCRLGLEHDFVKLLDFGLVKHLGNAEAQLTSDGMVLGTANYMPPEVVSAQHHLVSAVSDLYSLGAVAYFLVTGAHVFDGDSAAVVLFAQVHTQPQPPSHRSGRAIPAALESVILRCLEKDPARRPQSALELLALLDACDLGTPWSQELAREWWQHKRFLWSDDGLARAP